MDFFVNQAEMEVVAEEKLRAEVAKLQDPTSTKIGADKGRRVVS